MFGELQESRPVTQTTVRILTHVVNTGFVAAPLVTTQTFQRFRRDVMEGTLEEMIDNTFEAAGNDTSDISKRQAEFPGNPEQDNTKYVKCKVHSGLVTTNTQVGRLWVQDWGVNTLLGQQQ